MNREVLEKARVRRGVFRSTEADGFNGAFCLTLNGLPVKVIASDQAGWEHVSVSIHGASMVPSWSIMCQVKELFWGDEVWVVQFHPARSEYINNHPGCLHLWRPTRERLPTPPSIMVGIKDPESFAKEVAAFREQTSATEGAR